MRGQRCRLEVWEDLLYSSQLFFGEGSGKLILIRDVGSYVLLGTKFLCLAIGDELRVELGPEDSLQRSEVVVVGGIGHGRWMSSCCSCERDGRILARCTSSYMFVRSGP